MNYIIIVKFRLGLHLFFKNINIEFLFNYPINKILK
jgi:hypothetical protein